MKKLLVRFGGLTAVFGAIYGAGGVCPFCGQPGCPVGPAGAGLVGAAFAACATGLGKLAARKKSPEAREEINDGACLCGAADGDHVCSCVEKIREP